MRRFTKGSRRRCIGCEAKHYYLDHMYYGLAVYVKSNFAILHSTTHKFLTITSCKSVIYYAATEHCLKCHKHGRGESTFRHLTTRVLCCQSGIVADDDGYPSLPWASNSVTQLLKARGMSGGKSSSRPSAVSCERVATRQEMKREHNNMLRVSSMDGISVFLITLIMNLYTIFCQLPNRME